MTPEVEYVAGGAAYLYPAAGDDKPPNGAKVLLLTRGGVCIVGNWPKGHDDNGTGFFLGWAPLPKRDKVKEGLLRSMY